MNKHLFLTLCIALWHQLAFSEIIFVKEGSKGNGSAWELAFGDLQEALKVAKKGDQIWVATGKYYPVQCDQCTYTQRQISFVIPEGVELYGGFAGHERSLIQRLWQQYPSTLSGNIGSADSDDNSFNVVYTCGVGKNTVLDGFIIAEGQADGWENTGQRKVAGGGWYNDASTGISSPTIRNCIFLNNVAVEGAGFYNHAVEGEGNPKFINCTFVSNKAVRTGGGVLSNCADGQGAIQMVSCRFVNNEAGLGGAVSVVGMRSMGQIAVFDTHFANNKAIAGSVLFTLGLEKRQWPKFDQCGYFSNIASEGDLFWHQEGQQVPRHLLHSLAVQTSLRL